MLHNRDIDKIKDVNNKYQAADALGLVLYGRKGARFMTFHQAFLEGIEDSQVSAWIEPRGHGPHAVGYLFCEVFRPGTLDWLSQYIRVCR